MCKSKQNFKMDFKCKPASISISVPNVYCDILGRHYACFLGDYEWCEKRTLPDRMDGS